MHPSDERFLPDRQAAARYGVTVKALRSWDRRPELGFPRPVYLNGRCYRRLSDLVAWERQRAKPSVQQAHRTAWNRAHVRAPEQQPQSDDSNKRERELA